MQKPTFGTVGAHAAKDAPLVLCASFVVAEATARLLQLMTPHAVTFLVTGDEGQADEDLACAQYIARLASELKTDSADFVRRASESRAAADLAQGVQRGFTGVHPDDVPSCLQADRFTFAMSASWENSLLVPRPREVDQG